MNKHLFLIATVFCILAFSMPALSGPPAGTQMILSYDGYLQQTGTLEPPLNVFADTLIVVTNSHPTKALYASIEVFDKHGTTFGPPVPFYDGGSPWPNSAIPANAYGWITLGMLVGRDTHDPWGFPAGEKFSYRIYTTLPDNLVPPVVEVKQVVYGAGQTASPGEIIWQTELFKTWTETSLGGLNGTGIVWQQ